MAVTDAEVERVLKEIEKGASDPQHVASLVGAFMRRQPTVGHYVQSHASELGMEGTVLTLLHASVLVRCIEANRGRALGVLGPRELDAASNKVGKKLDGEDALESYLLSNITKEDATIGGKKQPIALRLLRLIGRAALDR